MAPIPRALDLPSDWTDHGVSGLVCTPADWQTVANFFIVNYLAHCLTVKQYPADTAKEVLITMFMALFLPSSGIARAIDSIIRHPRLRKLTELERACTAGALCIVVRKRSWKPMNDNILRNLYFDHNILYPKLDALSRTEEGGATRIPQLESKEVISASQLRSEPYRRAEVRQPPWMVSRKRTSFHVGSIEQRGCAIHGTYYLPDGYELAPLPVDAVVLPTRDTREGLTFSISSTYSLAKAFIAIFQTIYAAISLYRAKGEQVELYGYAAFGLTVVPYLLMTILNLIAQLVNADYPTLYMVESPEMEEARGRGGYFNGTVGSVDTDHNLPDQYMDNRERAGPWKVEELGQEGRTRLLNLNPENNMENTFYIDEIGKLHYDEDWIYIPTASAFRMDSERSRDLVSSSHSGKKRFEWPESNFPQHSDRSRYMFGMAAMILAAFTFTIVAVISKFQPGVESTSLQRGFVTAWFIVGALFGFVALIWRVWMDFLEAPGAAEADERDGFWSLMVGVWFAGSFLLIAFFVPAIGGLVMVGQMIVKYGACIRVS
ncbi:hypothetical protein B0T24DRAFT_568915 [Lasiosphaeria ovina]|uniref:Uncharacterized protein n=1 Tax=Lasiosphaeria ovina TaxID=92902 RepID=A0AAE0KMU1_9PEZI|nr:hypothetical protein B0T24DRAFT_568915 [Lasiosphaeria ovina]